MEQKNKALGRGLEQLFASEVLDFDSFESNIMDSVDKDDIIQIKLSDIRSNPYQPRKTFDKDALQDLTAIELAWAYKGIIDSLHITQDELAVKLGKSRSGVTNVLGLLRLPAKVQDMILEGKISMGHARELSKLEDREKILELADKIVKENLSVRDIENMSKDDILKKKNPIKRSVNNNQYDYVEKELREYFGTKVKIANKKIEINFENSNDLDRILEIMNVKIN